MVLSVADKQTHPSMQGVIKEASKHGHLSNQYISGQQRPDFGLIPFLSISPGHLQMDIFSNTFHTH